MLTRTLIAFTIAFLWPLAVRLIKPEQSVRDSIWEFAENKYFITAAWIGALGTLLGATVLGVVLVFVWSITSISLAAVAVLTNNKTILNSMVEAARYLSLAFVAFGTIWLVAANFRYELFGFSETIVLLTAAHFHAAGGCLVALSVLNFRESKTKLSELICLASIIAIPATAIGIQLGGVAEGVGAAFTICMAILLAISQVLVRPEHLKGLYLLKVISSLSLLIAMAFAFAYSLQHFGLEIIVSIDTMVFWHATLNTVGFIGAGLIYHLFQTRELLI